MFHRSSFRQGSFKPASWRFDELDTAAPSQVTFPGADDESVDETRRRIRAQNDALVALAVAVVAQGLLR